MDRPGVADGWCGPRSAGDLRGRGFLPLSSWRLTPGDRFSALVTGSEATRVARGRTGERLLRMTGVLVRIGVEGVPPTVGGGRPGVAVCGKAVIRAATVRADAVYSASRVAAVSCGPAPVSVLQAN